jgi:hypothetical protein
MSVRVRPPAPSLIILSNQLSLVFSTSASVVGLLGIEFRPRVVCTCASGVNPKARAHDRPLISPGRLIKAPQYQPLSLW